MSLERISDNSTFFIQVMGIVMEIGLFRLLKILRQIAYHLKKSFNYGGI